MPSLTLREPKRDPTARFFTPIGAQGKARTSDIAWPFASFQRELSCVRLKPQVQRLFESIATSEPPRQPAPPVDSAPKVAPTQQAQTQPVPAEDPCARDAERLARLRTDPSVDAITRFERELGCEHIRPQLRRLRESLGL